MMSWEGSPNFRWVKMHKRHRYRISCGELGVGRSKEDSYQAANRWWQAKLAELEKARVGEERSEAVSDIDRKILYASTHAPKLLPSLKRSRKAILDASPDERILPDQDAINENIKIAKLFGVTVPKDLDPMVSQHLFGERRLWEERLSGASLIGKERTVSYCTEAFLKEIQPRQQPKTFKAISDHLYSIMNESGVWTAGTDAGAVTEDTITSHYLWLVSRDYVPSSHNKRIDHFRRFVRWLWTTKRLQELPRNLDVEGHKKKSEHRAIPVYENVKQVIDALPDALRIWALLGLNCGMTNADLGALRWDQIDQRNWVLTRRRVKTGKNPKVPTVRYKLWPEVVSRLQMITPKKVLVFTTQQGRPMYHTRFVDDSAGRQTATATDNFAQRWSKVDPKPKIPLSHFRKISATALRSNNLYARFDEYFLGHVPKSVADRHYSAETDSAFFEALEFLHESLLGTGAVRSQPKQKTTKKAVRKKK
jgi:integrase